MLFEKTVFDLFGRLLSNGCYKYAIYCQKQRKPYQYMSQSNLSVRIPNRQGLTRYAKDLIIQLPIEITAHKKLPLTDLVHKLVRKCQNNPFSPQIRESLSIQA